MRMAEEGRRIEGRGKSTVLYQTSERGEKEYLGPPFIDVGG